MAAVSVLGLPAFAATLNELRSWNGSRWILLALLGALLLVGEMQPIPVARGDDAGDEVSISSTVALAMLMIAPPVAAVIAQAVALIADEARSRRMWLRLPFNIAQYTLALLAARWTFAKTTGISYDHWQHTLPQSVIGGGLAAAAVFFIVNNGLIGIAVALKLRNRISRQLVEDFRHQIVTSGVLLALAPVMAFTVEAHEWALPLLLLPLAAVHRSARLAYAREHEALHDALTGLGNRVLFNARLERVYQNRDTAAAVLLIDVDHFKEINDTLGHHAGDLLLIEIARRLRQATREGDVVARLGGDEFAVLAMGVGTEEAAQPLLTRVRQALHGSVSISGVRIDTTASVGVALASRETESAEALLRRADVAMYAAKRSRGAVSFYTSDSDEHTIERLTLLGDLRRATDNDQVYLAYQPKVDLHTGDVVGVEALARWRHPELGELSPRRFIPLAESTGLIDEMTQRLLEQGLRQLRQWHEAGHDLSLAVNVSARLLGAASFVDVVAEQLRHFDIRPRHLTLEVTESMIMVDLPSALATLRRLRDLDVRLSIDDFGTGYSSLAYLRKLAVDELKIDRSFVHRVAVDRYDAAIVDMAVRLGHEFGLTVVAEGVEDAAALDALRELGCDLAQGYHVAVPRPAAEMTTWLDTRRARIAEAV
jgi:diguanylate cyclase (GGDEF)-like protein